MKTSTINQKPILIKELGMLYATEKSKEKRRYGMYECPKCLKPYKASISTATNGSSSGCTSCKNIKHGGIATSLYCRWDSMKQRCFNKNHKNYKYYGSRGITIYEPWVKDFTKYREYVLCLPNAEKDGYLIDRFHNDANYEPMNLRWVTQAVQSRNTRKIHITNISGYRGVNLHKASKKWRATITVNKKHISLGYFKTAIEAAKAYDKYVLDNHLEHTINNVDTDTIQQKTLWFEENMI